MSQSPRKSAKRKTSQMLFFVVFVGGAYYWFLQKSQLSSFGMDFGAGKKEVRVIDDSMEYSSQTQVKTVEDFLQENHIKIKQGDYIFPNRERDLVAGMSIIIKRMKAITIMNNGKKIQQNTLAENVQQAVFDNAEIFMDMDDLISPLREERIFGGETIKITQVLIKEEVKAEPINFKTIVNEDDSIGWRIKKITQKGVQGSYDLTYKIMYYDGKEISRKLLNRNKTKDPVDEVVTQGTLVKVGKVHTGVASWYAFRGGLFAANPWLPMGSYVRVTNQDNGKSVIVKINDRGPFGNGRIIDLDKVAFAQIGSIGAGVINVKMEAITN